MVLKQRESKAVIGVRDPHLDSGEITLERQQVRGVRDGIIAKELGNFGESEPL